jgi:hypothetical protein
VSGGTTRGRAFTRETGTELFWPGALVAGVFVLGVPDGASGGVALVEGTGEVE